VIIVTLQHAMPSKKKKQKKRKGNKAVDVDMEEERGEKTTHTSSLLGR